VFGILENVTEDCDPLVVTSEINTIAPEDPEPEIATQEVVPAFQANSSCSVVSHHKYDGLGPEAGVGGSGTKAKRCVVVPEAKYLFSVLSVMRFSSLFRH
jgi:hypothetical protein